MLANVFIDYNLLTTSVEPLTLFIRRSLNNIIVITSVNTNNTKIAEHVSVGVNLDNLIFGV